MHDWKWDLKTGRCLSTSGHPIRSTKIDEVSDAVLSEAS
jgi:UDP-MurNAc hydroxylase